MKKFVFGLMLLISFNANAQKATISVDKNPVSVQESFVLTFSIDKQTADKPDFNEIKKYFDVLSVANSFNTQMINGFVSQKREYALTLMPRAEGKFEIKPIEFDGMKTNSLTIDVVADNQIKTVNKPTIKFDGFLDKTSAYVQEEINYSLVLIDDGGLELAEPRFADTQDFIIKNLGEPEVEDFLENGKRLRKITVKFALFPQKSGSLTVPAFEIKGYQIQELNFDNPFENTIFANMGLGFATQKKPIALRIGAKSVEVKSAAASFGGKWWLPATEVVLKDEFKTADYEVNKPIKRQITLEAVGVIDSQLPDLDFVKSENLKIYPNKPISQSVAVEGEIVSQKVFDVTYIPTTGGEVELPAITLDWFDVNENKVKQAILKSEKIFVSGASSVVKEAQKALQEKPEVKNKEPKVVVKKAKKDYSLYLIALASLGGGVIIGLLFARPKKVKLSKMVLGSKNIKDLESNLVLWGQGRFENVLNIKDVANNVADKDFEFQAEKLLQALYGKERSFNLAEFMNVFKKIANKKVTKAEDVILPKLYK